MTEPTDKASADAVPPDPSTFEPTEAEIDEWAARERKRREAWLAGGSRTCPG